MDIIDQVTNETAARSYSRQSHGKIFKPIQRPDTYQRLPEDVQLTTCEQQPVHTLGSKQPLAPRPLSRSRHPSQSLIEMTAKPLILSKITSRLLYLLELFGGPIDHGVKGL